MIYSRIALLSTLAAAFVLASLSAPAAAPHAAKVVYAFGQVKGIDAAGATRELRRGDVVGAGETVATARGRAQIKFTDGGFASLQPNTDYRIGEYHYEGKADGNERSFLNLLRGSVRLVTGAIGRTHRENFRISTKVATIGIRGTHGVITECVAGSCGAGNDGTKVKGTGGEWKVTVGTNTWGVGAGEKLSCTTTCTKEFAADPDRVEVGPPILGENRAGDEQSAQGDPCAVIACGGDDVAVLRNLIGGDVDGDFPETSAFNNFHIVTVNGVPIGGLVVDNENADFDDGDIGLLVNNLDGLRLALRDFPDPDVVALGNQILAAIPPEVAQALALNPAVLQPDDFHTTADGLVTMGRFAPRDFNGEGRLLGIDVFLDSQEIFIDPITLTGFQSWHVWYGADPGPITNMGQGYFPITDTTFSTALDGSSIGSGVVPFNPSDPFAGGWLSVDFGTNTGGLFMRVDHPDALIQVSGSIQFEANRKFFSETFMTGFDNFENSYPVQVDGAFVGPTTNGTPPRFGATYIIFSPSPIGGAFSGGPFIPGPSPGETL